MLTETQIFEYAEHPEKIIDPAVCNTVISFLGGHISDLVNEEFEKRLIASQQRVTLMNITNYTNAKAGAEWKISAEYLDWQRCVNKLRKFKAYRSDLKDRFQVLTNTRRY
jgi:hypothetical protein